MNRKLLLTSLLLFFAVLLVGCNKTQDAPEIDVVDGMTLFKSDSLNGYIVTAYEGTDRVINIPESHKGLDVVRIHFITFTNSLAEEINLPKTINAFFGLWRTFNLKKINVHPDNKSYYSEDGIIYSKDKKMLIQFPQNHEITDFVIPSFVEEIKDSAFIQTKNLRSVTLHSEIERLNDLTFQYSNLEEIIIPEDSKLTSIGEKVFDHTKLTNIWLPSGLKEIGYKTFNKTYITEINLGKNLETLNDTFAGMDYLEEITVDDTNNNFLTEDNVLYDKAKSALIHYPKQLNKANYQLPSTILSLENESLSENMFLRNINTLSLNYKTSDGILYNKDYSEIIVYPKLNETRELQVGLNLFGIENIENIAKSSFLERIVTDPNHSAYFSADGVLYNREITEILIYPKSNLVETFYINRVVERIRHQNFSPTHLKEVVVDENNQHFSSIDGILYNKNKTELILVPQSKVIEKIDIDKNITSILNGSLNNPYLKEIIVDKDNKNFYSIDGVLYQKANDNKSILIKVPTAKEVIRFKVPKDVYKISENAFYYHIYLEEIDFSNVKEILTLENYAIINTINLNKIIINVNSVLNKDSIYNSQDLEINIDIVQNDLYETLLWDFEWYKKGYNITLK